VRIYLHRHGDTRFLESRVLRTDENDGQWRDLLSTRGLAEMDALGRELARHRPFDLYVASPLPRTIQSACLVGARLGDVPLVAEPAFREVDDAPPTVWLRITDALRRIMAGPYHSVLISTHGSVVHGLALFLRGYPGETYTYDVCPRTGGYSWAEVDAGGRLRDACWDYTDHLTRLDARLPLRGDQGIGTIIDAPVASAGADR
jgi:broad specificity phosphatase PhoE